jgi:transaldolase
MEDYGDGVGQVEDLLRMLEASGLPAKVVAASFKNANQVHRLVVAGIQAVTVPPEVVRSMVDHPGTRIAVDEFSAAWREAYGRDTFAAE